MTEETPEEKLARYEFVLDAYVRELATLREENERLKSAAGAHEVLKNIYSDATQPTGHRLKAAGLALPHEMPRLMPEKAAIDAACEEISEPLPVIIERQRARMDAMQREAGDIEVSPSGAVRVLPRPGSNGGNGSDQ